MWITSRRYHTCYLLGCCCVSDYSVIVIQISHNLKGGRVLCCCSLLNCMCYGKALSLHPRSYIHHCLESEYRNNQESKLCQILYYRVFGCLLFAFHASLYGDLMHKADYRDNHCYLFS